MDLKERQGGPGLQLSGMLGSHLPGKYKILSSIPSTAEKKRKKDRTPSLATRHNETGLLYFTGWTWSDSRCVVAGGSLELSPPCSHEIKAGLAQAPVQPQSS